jgi:hypothetical protein
VDGLPTQVPATTRAVVPTACILADEYIPFWPKDNSLSDLQENPRKLLFAARH